MDDGEGEGDGAWTPGGPAAGSKRPRGGSGRWTDAEHDLFVAGLKRHGRNWRRIQDMVSTRSVLQIRTHAQKYFQKLAREEGLAAAEAMFGGQYGISDYSQLRGMAADAVGGAAGHREAEEGGDEGEEERVDVGGGGGLDDDPAWSPHAGDGGSGAGRGGGKRGVGRGGRAPGGRGRGGSFGMVTRTTRSASGVRKARVRDDGSSVEGEAPLVASNSDQQAVAETLASFVPRHVDGSTPSTASSPAVAAAAHGPTGQDGTAAPKQARGKTAGGGGRGARGKAPSTVAAGSGTGRGGRGGVQLRQQPSGVRAVGGGSGLVNRDERAPVGPPAPLASALMQTLSPAQLAQAAEAANQARMSRVRLGSTGSTGSRRIDLGGDVDDEEALEEEEELGDVGHGRAHPSHRHQQLHAGMGGGFSPSPPLPARHRLVSDATTGADVGGVMDDPMVTMEVAEQMAEMMAASGAPPSLSDRGVSMLLNGEARHGSVDGGAGGGGGDLTMMGGMGVFGGGGGRLAYGTHAGPSGHLLPGGLRSTTVSPATFSASMLPLAGIDTSFGAASSGSAGGMGGGGGGDASIVMTMTPRSFDVPSGTIVGPGGMSHSVGGGGANGNGLAMGGMGGYAPAHLPSHPPPQPYAAYALPQPTPSTMQHVGTPASAHAGQGYGHGFGYGAMGGASGGAVASPLSTGVPPMSMPLPPALAPAHSWHGGTVPWPPGHGSSVMGGAPTPYGLHLPSHAQHGGYPMVNARWPATVPHAYGSQAPSPLPHSSAPMPGGTLADHTMPVPASHHHSHPAPAFHSSPLHAASTATSAAIPPHVSLSHPQYVQPHLHHTSQAPSHVASSHHGVPTPFDHHPGLPGSVHNVEGAGMHGHPMVPHGGGHGHMAPMYPLPPVPSPMLTAPSRHQRGGGITPGSITMAHRDRSGEGGASSSSSSSNSSSSNSSSSREGGVVPTQRRLHAPSHTSGAPDRDDELVEEDSESEVGTPSSEEGQRPFAAAFAMGDAHGEWSGAGGRAARSPGVAATMGSGPAGAGASPSPTTASGQKRSSSGGGEGGGLRTGPPAKRGRWSSSRLDTTTLTQGDPSYTESIGLGLRDGGEEGMGTSGAGGVDRPGLSASPLPHSSAALHPLVHARQSASSVTELGPMFARSTGSGAAAGGGVVSVGGGAGSGSASHRSVDSSVASASHHSLEFLSTTPANTGVLYTTGPDAGPVGHGAGPGATTAMDAGGSSGFISTGHGAKSPVAAGGGSSAVPHGGVGGPGLDAGDGVAPHATAGSGGGTGPGLTRSGDRSSMGMLQYGSHRSGSNNSLSSLGLALYPHATTSTHMDAQPPTTALVPMGGGATTGADGSGGGRVGGDRGTPSVGLDLSTGHGTAATTPGGLPSTVSSSGTTAATSMRGWFGAGTGASVRSSSSLGVPSPPPTTTIPITRMPLLDATISQPHTMTLYPEPSPTTLQAAAAVTQLAAQVAGNPPTSAPRSISAASEFALSPAAHPDLKALVEGVAPVASADGPLLRQGLTHGRGRGEGDGGTMHAVHRMRSGSDGSVATMDGLPPTPRTLEAAMSLTQARTLSNLNIGHTTPRTVATARWLGNLATTAPPPPPPTAMVEDGSRPGRQPPLPAAYHHHDGSTPMPGKTAGL